MTKNIKTEVNRYSVDEEKLLQFEKVLLTIESHFEGYIFNVRNCSTICKFLVLINYTELHLSRI